MEKHWPSQGKACPNEQLALDDERDAANLQSLLERLTTPDNRMSISNLFDAPGESDWSQHHSVDEMAAQVNSGMRESDGGESGEEEDRDPVFSFPPLKDQLKVISLAQSLMEDKF